MNYIVAVSGGVDSVVLLDILSKQREHTLIVAHFDHGIRSDSAADARFVAELARSYSLPFEVCREELGARASELVARERRYAFLRNMATKHAAHIVTAHHVDDLIETIAINLQRGTGWRGLAVLDTPGIERPLLKMRKDDIYTYALSRGLEWVEDETDSTDAYLRNRLRRRIQSKLANDKRDQLGELWHNQVRLKQAIINEELALVGQERVHSRYFFTYIDALVATELLRFVANQGITRPQAERALHAIKTAHAGTVSKIGTGVQLTFTAHDFTIQTP